ncbi:MAG: hypothetical protein J6A77_12580 [Lachnospiraceae bacterium]|nr:hypothetical protein [Lachnospiraceae bacterium]
MNIKFTDEAEHYVLFEYNQDKQLFELKNEENRNVLEYIPVLELDMSYNPENFEVIFLNNKREDCTENSIYQVKVTDKRLGWIFPIQALLSSEHDYVKNPYFLKYAFVATWHLLNKIYQIDEKRCPEFISLDDFYDETINILILDQENCSKIKDFVLDDYVVSLYQKGYSFSGNGNLYSDIEKPQKSIHLKSISKEIKNKKCLNELFKEMIPKNSESFSGFYVYYQVVEILISDIFESDFKNFIEVLNTNTDNLFEKRDELSNMAGEKGRVRRLFHDFSQINALCSSNLNQYCIKLLEVHGYKISADFAENLYLVRCLLVHKLYVLDKKDEEILKQINILFLDVLMEVLLSFKISKECDKDQKEERFKINI